MGDGGGVERRVVYRISDLDRGIRVSRRRIMDFFFNGSLEFFSFESKQLFYFFFN